MAGARTVLTGLMNFAVNVALVGRCVVTAVCLGVFVVCCLIVLIQMVRSDTQIDLLAFSQLMIIMLVVFFFHIMLLLGS